MELHQHECPACHRLYDCECDDPDEDDSLGPNLCLKCFAIVEAEQPEW